MPTTTTYEVPFLSTTSLSYSDDCVVTTSAPVSTSTVPAAPKQTQGSSAPPASIESTPRNGSSAPAAGYSDQGGPAAPAEDLFNSAPPAGTGPVEPPLTPTPEKDNGGLAVPPAGAAISSPPLGDEYSRTANKPVATEFNPSASNLAPGALRGEVVSRDTKTPLAGVTVIFTDLQRNYADKQVTTDATGHFEVLLPNADWSVAVAESDNKPNTQYGRITSTGGRFYDSFDRSISSLRLNH